jgi:hypothetical protein
VFAVAALLAAIWVMGPNPWVAALATIVPIMAGVVWKLAGRSIVLNYIGDAARYLSPKPGNVAHRQAIREAGVDLLSNLHDTGDYDRIVVVGHSLGSVIAYDILTFAWIKLHREHRQPRHPNFSALRAVERAIGTSIDAEQARLLQYAAWEQTRRNTQSWLVTDLVTLGSPLAHAETLMAPTPEAFADLIADRVAPRCPPICDARRCTFDLAYPHFSHGSAQTFTVFHHAALFATTRWTNLISRRSDSASAAIPSVGL